MNESGACGGGKRLSHSCLMVLAAWMALSAAGLSACAGPGRGGASSRPEGVIWTLESVGLSTPESVLYDADADEYLVSNIAGSPGETDGNGFISRIRPDGQVDTLEWIAGGVSGVGLDAPKGMALVGDRLYVSDIHVVRVFDRRTGEALETIAVEGAGFLNDVTPAPGGGVYVSDSATNRILRIDAGGTVSTIEQGGELIQPNGLLSDDRGLIAVGFGGKMVFVVSPKGELERFAELPAKGLDGIVVTGEGRYVVSSWEGKALYAIDRNGAVTTLVDGLRAPADIGYDSKRNRLLVPLFKDDKIVALSATPVGP